MTLSSKTKKIALIIAIVLVSVAVLAGVSTGIYFGVTIIPVQGVVMDTNNNPISNVSVTDGRNVVATDENGRFKLKGWHKGKFVVVTNPTGYWTEDYYKEIKRGNGDYKFTLEKTEEKVKHTFMQVTDTEINENGVGDWFSTIKEQVAQTDPAFIIHTGDICYEAGLRKHKTEMNSENMGVPVRYTIGNHDFVRYGKYGEQLFEEIYGPVNYSFDIGNIHYIVSSLAYGDTAARYSFGDVVKWIKNDIAQVPDSKRIIIFNHDVCRDETGMVLKSGTTKIELNKEGVIAWINGHLHYNFINDYNGILNISTTPLVGGIDGSIGGVRLVNIDNNRIADTYMRYTDYNPTKSEAGSAWQTKLTGRNLYTDPQLVGDRVYVGLMENDYPRKPVFACLNAKNGEVIWERNVATSIKNNFYINGDIIVVQDSSGIVYGLNAFDGRELWQKDLQLVTYRYSMTGITGEGDKVYCGNSRFVYCFNANTGEQIWKYSGGNGEPSAFKLQIYGDQLIVGAHWRKHYALDKNTGKKLWVSEIPRADALISTIYYKEKIYIFESGKVFELNQKGNILNTYDIDPLDKSDEKGETYNFNVGCAPYLDGNIAYVGTNKHGLIALNLDTMKVVWEFEVGENMIYASPYSGKGSKGVDASVNVQGDLIYFGAMDGNLYVINKSNGIELDSFTIGSSILSKVIVGNIDNQKFVIVSDFEGRVTRIDLNEDGSFERKISQ